MEILINRWILVHPFTVMVILAGVTCFDSIGYIVWVTFPFSNCLGIEADSLSSFAVLCCLQVSSKKAVSERLVFLPCSCWTSRHVGIPSPLCIAVEDFSGLMIAACAESPSV